MLGFLFFIFRYLPRALASMLLSFLAMLAYWLGVRRKVALEGLATAFPQLQPPELKRLAVAHYRHLGACAADFLRSPALPDSRLFAMVRADGWEKVEPLLEAKKGFIVATAHYGNFELFGVYAARRGVPLTILTRELKGKANARWVGTRALAGIKEIHKGMSNLVEAVRRGEALALLIDQNMLPKRAVFVPFFGKLAATTPAPAVVADRTGAPVFLVVMRRESDGTYRTVFDGPHEFRRTGADLPADVAEFTAMLNERFERLVRQDPAQWFWIHRRWKTRPPDEVRA